MSQFSFIDSLWISAYLASDEAMSDPLVRIPVLVGEGQTEFEIDLSLPSAPAYRLVVEAMGLRERVGRASPTLYGLQYLGEKTLGLEDLGSGPIEIQLRDAVPFPSVQREFGVAIIDRLMWGSVPGALAFAVRDTFDVLAPEVEGTQYSILGGTGIAYRVCAVFPGGLRSAFSEPMYLRASGPFLNSIQPGAVAPGQGVLGLALFGSSFQLGATMLWDERRLPTDYEASSVVGAQIPSDYTASPGTFRIRVENPDGQMSNTLEFPVAVVTPVISGVLPDPVPADLIAGVTLTVSGANFEPGAVVTWDGADLSTEYTSSAELLPFVPRDLIANEGTATLQVRNPSGQRSNTWNVVIRAL